VAPVRERRKGADATAIDARQLLNRATSLEAQTLAESERLEGEERRLSALIDQLNHAEETLSDDLAELTEQIVTNDAELFNLREELPNLEEASRSPGNEWRASLRRVTDSTHCAHASTRRRLRSHVARPSSPNGVDSSSNVAVRSSNAWKPFQ